MKLYLIYQQVGKQPKSVAAVCTSRHYANQILSDIYDIKDGVSKPIVEKCWFDPIENECYITNEYGYEVTYTTEEIYANDLI